MSDSIDEVLDNDEAEDEIEDLTSQVCFISFWYKSTRIKQFLCCSNRFFQIIHIANFRFLLNFLSYSQVLDEIGVDVASQVGIFGV